MKLQRNAKIPKKTLEHLEWNLILERFSKHCRGPVAQELALRWELAADEQAVRLRVQRVDEARSILDQARQPPLGQPSEIKRAIQRATRGGVLDIDQLCEIGLTLEASTQTRRFFKEFEDSHLALGELCVGLADLLGFSKEILQTFTSEGEVSDGASGELGELRLRVNHLHTQLKDRVSHLLSDDSFSGMLQDDFYTIRDDRYVLPIKSGHKRHVEGIVHGWSSSGSTVYIEPRTVVEANNKLKMAQADVKQEIHRILTRLSQRVAHHAEEIERSHEALIQLDLVFAAAHLSKELRCTSPMITPEPMMSVQEARHPILELSGVKVIPNEIELGGDQAPVLVITGPNAGGKTVVMKTAGLLVLMTLAGFHIPAAAGSVIPLVPGLFSDMGDEQSLSEGQSTFSGHINNIHWILKRLKPNSLILLDELAIGTDPLQGSALAQAILEHFVDRQTLVLVTTHYEPLKLLPQSDPRFRNGAVEYDEREGTPTYRLRYDIPGSSSALQIAKKLGLPHSLIDRARALTGEQHQRLEQVITQMEEEISMARHAKADAEREAGRLRALNADVSAKDKKLKARLKKAVETERSRALHETRALRDRVRRLRGRLQEKTLDADEMLEIEQSLNESAEGITEAQLQDKLSAYPADLDLDALQLGQRIWVITLDTHAELSRLPDHKGRCEVQAGLLSIQVNVSVLRKSKPSSKAKKTSSKVQKNREEASRPKTPKKRTTSQITWESASPQVPDNTCDVRGKRGDEAIAVVIDFLDELYGRGHTSAFIIHGHGTGALKRHIRGWLPSCDYVNQHRSGQPHEGGDGVTAVLLTTQSL